MARLQTEEDTYTDFYDLVHDAFDGDPERAARILVGSFGADEGLISSFVERFRAEPGVSVARPVARDLMTDPVSGP